MLAAVVLYQRVDHAPLLACIDALLEKDGLAIVADPNRGVADRFAEAAFARGIYVRLSGASADNRLGERVEGRRFFLRRPADKSSRLGSVPIIGSGLLGRRARNSETNHFL